MKSYTAIAALMLLGCSDSTGPESFLPDGSYEVSLTSLASPSSTPGWALSDPKIQFTKTGESLVITASTLSYQELGEPRFIQKLEDSWNVHIGLQADAFLGAETKYFAIRFNKNRCLEAAAIDPARFPNSRFEATCTVLQK